MTIPFVNQMDWEELEDFARRQHNNTLSALIHRAYELGKRAHRKDVLNRKDCLTLRMEMARERRELIIALVNQNLPYTDIAERCSTTVAAIGQQVCDLRRAGLLPPSNRVNASIKREGEVIRMVLEGRKAKSIASALKTSEGAIRVQIYHLRLAGKLPAFVGNARTQQRA